MDIINLSKKTKARSGKIEIYWFENKHIDLENTQFHRVTISLDPFDSGLDYVRQPEETEIVFEWYKLNLVEPEELDGLNLSTENYPEAEASIYIGNAHNWCDVKELVLRKMDSNRFEAIGSIIVDFENERVGKNEKFDFSTIVQITSA